MVELVNHARAGGNAFSMLAATGGFRLFCGDGWQHFFWDHRVLALLGLELPLPRGLSVSF